MELVTVLQNFGFPIFLVIYYLAVIVPAQNKKAKEDQVRYDSLVDQIIKSQKECAEKMNAALHDNTKAINEMIELIEKKIK